MNTPYAYAIVQGKDGRENVSLQFDHPEMCGQQYNAVIPLYTTPQTKPLSDEEIWNMYLEATPIHPQGLVGRILEFARAIEAKVRGEK